jgi:hypothetical protein
MNIDEKKILYSFEVKIEKEVEETVEKKKKRKNKETGKMEVVTTTETTKVKKDVPFNVLIKKPTRTQLEDGDMFYSLELNKYIKMGLLTKAMLAKQYGSQGGVWTEKEQGLYADLIYKMHQKQLEIQQFSILGENGKLSARQQEKLQVTTREMASLKKELTEYEMVQNSLFDHTADIKARNRTIMWYILFLTHFSEGEGEDAVIEQMFEGEDYEERFVDYEDKEESDDKLYQRAIDKISSIVTIWYISGHQEKENLEEFMEQMKRDADFEDDDFDIVEEDEESVESKDPEGVTQDA